MNYAEVKAIKSMRLKTFDGYYLLACEDKKRVGFTGKNKGDCKGTIWKITWLTNGRCNLWSIYGKVLAVDATNINDLTVCQAATPVSDGAACWDAKFKTEHRVEVKLSTNFASIRYLLNPVEYSKKIYLTRSNWYTSKVHSPWEVEVVESSEIESEEQRVIQGGYNHPQLYGNNQLGGWQVGQVVFNISDGVRVSRDGNNVFSHYNSGHNVNGSGKQTNGDVKHHHKT